MENKKMMWVWVLIVVLVIVGLVFITIKYKKAVPKEELGTEQNVNMENTQKIEGVTITILKEGTGDVSKLGDMVAVSYTGSFTDGKVFDSNVDPKFNHVEPFIFTVGGGQVIKGWDLGVVGMKIGEKRKLELAPEVAYGINGQGPIPPNSTLIFEVELLGIK